MSLCVIILTYNEEIHIARAIKSVAAVASQIIVIDSFSTDNTVEMASALGAVVLQNPFVNQAKQFHWALENAPVTSDWVMRLDADEVIEPELSAEISSKLPSLGPEVAGINLKRKHIFLGRWIKNGGRYPLILTRIWRTGQGRIEDRWMDEHVVVCGGKTIQFKNPFSDHNLNDLSFFTKKHNEYATREAVEVLARRFGLFADDFSLTIKGTSTQAFAKRLIKEKFYNRIPFPISSLGYFLYRYIFQLGFLDGREGLIYHFLQGYWYRFLVGAKVTEFESSLHRFSKTDEIRQELARVSKLAL